MSWYGIKMDANNGLLATQKSSISLSKEEFDEMKQEIQRQTKTSPAEDVQISRSFISVQLHKVTDCYDISIDYTSNSETTTLDMTLSNTTTGIMFKTEFDRQHLHQIVDGCILGPDQVVRMLIETLSAPELITKNIRLFLAENMDKGILSDHFSLRSMYHKPLCFMYNLHVHRSRRTLY